MERAQIIELCSRWISEQQAAGTIEEGHLIGSVLRAQDFGPRSDVDLVLSMKGPAVLPAIEVSKLQFKTNRRLEVTVFTHDQLTGFSPCHRKSNILMQLSRAYPQSRMARLLGDRGFFTNEFQRFWRWHTVLRIVEVYGRDLSLKTYEEQLQTYAARAAIVEQRGFLRLEPSESLLDFLGHWSTPWWHTGPDAAAFAVSRLAVCRQALTPLHGETVPMAREDWLIREFWDERARLVKLDRMEHVLDFLMDDAAKLKVKIDKVRA